jgi:hypothetical protein
MVRGQGIHR